MNHIHALHPCDDVLLVHSRLIVGPVIEAITSRARIPPGHAVTAANNGKVHACGQNPIVSWQLGPAL